MLCPIAVDILGLFGSSPRPWRRRVVGQPWPSLVESCRLPSISRLWHFPCSHRLRVASSEDIPPPRPRHHVVCNPVSGVGQKVSRGPQKSTCEKRRSTAGSAPRFQSCLNSVSRDSTEGLVGKYALPRSIIRKMLLMVRARTNWPGCRSAKSSSASSKEGLMVVILEFVRFYSKSILANLTRNQKYLATAEPHKQALTFKLFIF